MITIQHTWNPFSVNLLLAQVFSKDGYVHAVMIPTSAAAAVHGILCAFEQAHICSRYVVSVTVVGTPLLGQGICCIFMPSTNDTHHHLIVSYNRA
jgi:hypothetical protein